jgi:hypothetical protein
MRSRSTGSAGRRAWLGAATSTGLLLLLALPNPALAAVPDQPGPVQDVVDTVDDVARSDDPIEEVIDAVDDIAGDVTGTENPIQETVEDVVKTIDDTVDDAEETVDDVVDRAGGRVNDVVDAVDEATGGAVGDVVGGGQGGNGDPGTGAGPGARSPNEGSLTPNDLVMSRAHRRSQRAARDASLSAEPAMSSATTGTGQTETAVTTSAEPGLGERLREAALDASKKLAVPLALMLVVLGYLIAQYWADRKDPKLVLAPVDADHDLLSFS